MELKVGNSYILVVEGTNRKLTYHCTIIAVDDSSVTFTDKFGSKFSYRRDAIISSEEISK